ncbi:cytochrome-c peroxidase [Bradyrhizobium sp. AUGA SZCCT0176]|uniref:cytochrome-c peroxidase n=1 Tax=Bradyrhizobium sp. AUGA SZCCT0176 TaxID=2807664 RepID=UPI0020137D39|nr:cytochrome c peroxidase [Bradyrhizobium sp. AUGA SZCCT0176]
MARSSVRGVLTMMIGALQSSVREHSRGASARGFRRSVLFSSAAATVFVGIIGCASITFGAAIVGRTRHVGLNPQPAMELDVLKAKYRRPAFIPFPRENPYTPEKASLGKRLFFDTRLSLSSSQSCASCHSPGFSWGDGLSVGVGHGMVKLGRRSPSIVNTAWATTFMWDGRWESLEEQALDPIQSAGELNMPIERLMDRLASVAGYKLLFAAAFPDEGMNPKTLADAIATYERTVVSDHAPFDAWIEGAEGAIPEQAKRGFVIFNTKGRCASCHEGWSFTNDGFHDIGIPSDDPGRARQLPQITKMNHAFKTPGLREIVRRGPYMHNGSIATLEEVVEHYDQGGIDRPSRSDLIGPLGLTSQEKVDLVAFLSTLTSNAAATTVPVLPR